MEIRVAAAQLDVVVGDLAGNVERIVRALRQAEAQGADVCVFPELAVTGYPPEDLLLKSGFVADNEAALEQVAEATRTCAAVVGFVQDLVGAPGPSAGGGNGSADGKGTVAGDGRTLDGATAGPMAAESPNAGAEERGPLWRRVQPHLANAAAVCAGGKVLGVYHKRLLPNYSVFDEQRWFTPGEGPAQLYEIAGVCVGVSICEDIWAARGPVAALGEAGAQLVVNINASPYSRGRRAERLAMLRDRTDEVGCAIVYVNQVGGQDELVFDGASLFLSADGRLLAAGVQFAQDLVVVDVPVPERPPRSHPAHAVAVPTAHAEARGSRPRLTPALPDALDAVEEVYEALVLGTRDYLGKNGFAGAVVGLSGGIDSSLVATIAADAIGRGKVHGVAMPSRYSSAASVADAGDLAQRLGIDLSVVPIEAAHACLVDVLTGALGSPPTGITDENLQSRLRGVVLMAISNATGWIVLTTGNKSEVATGYSTLYGDSAGGFAVIKDVPKTLVYELCRHRNARAERAGLAAPVPPSVLDKPPSAELRPDQRDDQSLPPYELLDPVLEAYVEHDRTAADLVADGFDPELAALVVRLVDRAEYKRRQVAPGVRITNKAFGRDRRMPITNGYVPRILARSPTATGSGPQGHAAVPVETRASAAAPVSPRRD